MKKRKYKQLLASVIACSMVLSGMPATAYAAGNDTAQSLAFGTRHRAFPPGNGAAQAAVPAVSTGTYRRTYLSAAEFFVSVCCAICLLWIEYGSGTDCSCLHVHLVPRADTIGLNSYG